MGFRNIQWLLGALFVFVAGIASAQQAPDFSELTLSFENITSTNVNQTVNETGGNEKEVEFGDFDNDGDPDVVIAVALSDFGQRRNKLYRNDNGVLNEVSGTSVIPGFSSSDTARCAFFRDYDQDGWLDIIIVCDGNSGSGNNESPGKTKYYRNVGGTSFVNESSRLSNQGGSACNGTAADFDGNGYCDLMMCNYPGSSQDTLGLNNINGAGPGQFTIVTNTHYPQESRYGVHSEAADMNGDGLLDFLVCNETSSPSFIYYNNNEGAGSGPGDFRYGGSGAASTVPDTSGGNAENAMVPADFNGDGMMDFYYANAGGASSLADEIYINIGNDANNKALFTQQALPSEFNNETIKATINDLDNDGRPDVVVMSEFRRPYILRNTSENGNVSFIQWTPAAFTTAHEGWQAKSDDVTGNGRADILVGANSNDHLFGNVDSSLTDASALSGGALPNFHNSAPIAISGDIGTGDTQTFSRSIPSGARVSVLLRSYSDLTVVVRQGASVIANSQTVGFGTDEAVEFTSPGGTITFEVTLEGLSYDANGDGFLNLLDISGIVDCLSGATSDCDFMDVNDNGGADLLDLGNLVDRLSSASQVDGFVIEFLSRTN